MILSIIGKTLIAEGILLLLPMLVGVVYSENNLIAFLIPSLIALSLGVAFNFIKSKDKSIYAKEGFVTVAIVWILMSLIGALPFVISGEIPNYINALFETVSGFTTTGASILEDVEILSKASMFWRLFTHWIGGMGVLVFILALIPSYDSGIMHVFRAESPGPVVGKLVSKLTRTARILYGIYVSMTVLEIIMLLFGGNSLYDSVLLSFSTAGTGGFGIKNTSAMEYSLYSQMVIAVFMFLFGINFNFYYLILIRCVRKALKMEEVRWYFTIVIVATVLIAVNLLSSTLTFLETLPLAFFQVTSISSTTGLITANFDTWPAFSQAILMFLTIIGACGVSTGGGMKIARLGILVKSTGADIRRLVSPRCVTYAKFEGQQITAETERNVKAHFLLWIFVVALSTLLLSLDFCGLYSSFSATLACIGNVGPGFSAVGPVMNYASFSQFSKVWLSFVMLVGRLEIFPMLILFSPKTWKRI